MKSHPHPSLTQLTVTTAKNKLVWTLSGYETKLLFGGNIVLMISVIVAMKKLTHGNLEHIK
jgi:lipid-A-disaccharide synthase-like uncharacterized protein